MELPLKPNFCKIIWFDTFWPPTTTPFGLATILTACDKSVSTVHETVPSGTSLDNLLFVSKVIFFVVNQARKSLYLIRKTNTVMSARELKTELHEQIEALTDEQAMEVHEYISTQYLENDPITTTPEILDELRNDLAEAQRTNYTGITTNELQQKMKQWLTR